MEDDFEGELRPGVKLLIDSAPSAPSWSTVNLVRSRRKRRRAAALGGGAVMAGLIGAGLVSRQVDNSEVVVATTHPDPQSPCVTWIAVHTLFDASTNPPDPVQAPDQVVTAEQAVFLATSGDVPDRVAARTGHDASDLVRHIAARANPDLGTIEITAWGDGPFEARELADHFAEGLLESVADILDDEIGREKLRLQSEIQQLEADLAGLEDNRPGPGTRGRLQSEITQRQQQVNALDQRAAAGSNIYSFGSSEAFQVTADQLSSIFRRSTSLPDC
jgi:hypothetical protein